MDGQTHPRCKKRYGLDGLLSLYPYTGIIQRAIKQMKYRFAFRVVKDVLDTANVDSVTDWKQKMEGKNILIIPIPLHASRLYYRGFNQSEIVANYIGKQLDIQVEGHTLFRMKKTLPQVDMKNRSERLGNMKDVFDVSNIYISSHHSVVLLIDDVFTTGATMRSAASVLKRKGIPTVWGLTIAQ